jgi:hypothetical protein
MRAAPRAILALWSALALGCGASGGALGPGAWVSEPQALDGTTAHEQRLEFRVAAEPIRIGAAWGVVIHIVADNVTDGQFEIAGRPPLRLTGHQMTRDDEEISFDDGCSAKTDEPIRLGRGDRTRFKRTYGHGTDEALRGGETVTLDLALCHVKTPAGERVRSMPVARLMMAASAAGEPTITVSAPEPRSP